MAVGEFAPGHYAATWNGNDVGLTNGPKILRRRYSAIEVDTDKYGAGVDGIYKTGPVFLALTVKEWTAAVRGILWPFGADFGIVGANGRLLSDLAQALVLTAQTGTPAATKGPATITFSKAIIAPESDWEIPLGNVERDVPILFRCFPYLDGSDLRHFTTTDPI